VGRAPEFQNTQIHVVARYSATAHTRTSGIAARPSRRDRRSRDTSKAIANADRVACTEVHRENSQSRTTCVPPPPHARGRRRPPCAPRWNHDAQAIIGDARRIEAGTAIGHLHAQALPVGSQSHAQAFSVRVDDGVGDGLRGGQHDGARRARERAERPRRCRRRRARPHRDRPPPAKGGRDRRHGDRLVGPSPASWSALASRVSASRAIAAASASSRGVRPLGRDQRRQHAVVHERGDGDPLGLGGIVGGGDGVGGDGLAARLIDADRHPAADAEGDHHRRGSREHRIAHDIDDVRGAPPSWVSRAIAYRIGMSAAHAICSGRPKASTAAEVPTLSRYQIQGAPSAASARAW
jgi:hypothetical protein